MPPDLASSPSSTHFHPCPSALLQKPLSQECLLEEPTPKSLLTVATFLEVVLTLGVDETLEFTGEQT